ncbi:hypothetical protein HCN44_003167 [Aphidius gifuensis]|uniref:Sorting nexin-13 n=1 Tax=Aphidius gifuensis TaxID=684658 RepID=A0A834XIL5_APHGI|nr:sorting nexin-13-like [Aphidius gifuensis]KAF7987405.1 hypothetical protein HCN44_003167 [Aphidius gifuensis]
MNIMINGLIGGVSIIILVGIFGIFFIIKLVICLIVLTIGVLTCIYKKYTPKIDDSIKLSKKNLYKKTELLKCYLDKLSMKKNNYSLDKRVTGSHIIDESLQEILDFIIRDFIESWYNDLTNDDEFIKSVRDTAQKIAINIANRFKNVDWIQYLTTRLVDDVASHLRLYRQSRAKIKQLNNVNININSNNNSSNNNNNNNNNNTSSSSSSNSSGTPKRLPTHRRNKSETDVSWYSQSKFYIPNLTSLGEPMINNNKKTQSTNNIGPDNVDDVDDDDTNSNNNNKTLENIFFNLEFKMENNLLCRDEICTNNDKELSLLNELSDILLYLLLPKCDFDCITIRLILRELLVNIIIRPIFDLLSDPDYINQTFIMYFLNNKLTTTLSSDIFLTILKITNNIDELISTKNIINHEIILLRSRDSGGDDDLIVKQQLNSLNYVKKIIDNKIGNMQDGIYLNDNDFINNNSIVQTKLINIPLDELLKNNIALSYFIDYMQYINSENYLFFYLNIYGWRVSAEQQLSDIELYKINNKIQSTATINCLKRKIYNLNNLKDAALKIYQQYLSDKSSFKIKLDDVIVKKFIIRLKNESVKENWFDELSKCCYDKLQNYDKFLPSFKRSKSYIKLLAELDLLKDNISDDDIKSLDNISLSSIDDKIKSSNSVQSNSNSSTSLTSIDNACVINDDDGDDKNTNVCINNTATTSANDYFKVDESTTFDEATMKKLQQGKYNLIAEIIETGIVNDHGKTYGIYAISVCKKYDNGYNEKWHIYRRYSDFHDLHQKIKDKYYDLAKLPFPAKKTFHNMDRAVLEKRMIMLNLWMDKLTKQYITDGHMGLQNMLLCFLEQGEYDKGVTGGQISRTIDTLVNPIKTSMKTVTQAVKTMPDNMINTVDGVMDNISKFFGNPRKNSGFYESTKVGASIDTETDDNIPLRIILLLMDEVFDLKVRNQWLRRRIVTLVRQIIRTMFGDIVNRRIVEYVSFLTSPKNVATYLQLFKQSYWPNGVRADAKPPRDSETKNRTRVAAKVALLSCLSDELKHIIGSETTRRGLLLVFELFQMPVLNRRLLYVLFEGIIENLFPDNNLIIIIRKLYSKSPRVINNNQQKINS